MSDTLDFFAELNKIKEESDNTKTNDEYNNICFISGDILEKDHIQLQCNHRFNYVCLFNDMINQKKPNSYDTKPLNVTELRCPYCRSVQNQILPYRNTHITNQKIYGVNYPAKYCMKNYSCQYVFRRGKNKGNTCNKKCDSPFCKQHEKYYNL